MRRTRTRLAWIIAIAAVVTHQANAVTAVPEPSSRLPMPTSYRLYKLCEIQDPQCMPLLRELVRQIVEVNPRCAPFRVPDQNLYGTFMQVVSRDQSILRYSPLLVEMHVYGLTIANCATRLPPSVQAQMSQRDVQPAPRITPAKSATATEAEVAPMIKRERWLNDRCQSAAHADCATRDKVADRLKSKGWCYGHEPQPMSDRQWEPCLPQ